MANQIKAMILSVGGAPAPIILSLNRTKPEYICFFVSKETRKMIDEDILPALNFKPRHHDWIITSNAESLSDCYSLLVKKMPDLLEKWEIQPKHVCVDFTGGTKTMSVALALATIEKSCCYSYVGGDERSKDGVGVVVNGKEKMWFLENPWDEIAFGEKREVSILFNKARYGSAVEVLDKCVAMVSRDQRPFFKALREMVIGYDLWDRFKHLEAKKHLYRSKDVLSALGTEKKEIRMIAHGLEKNLQFLEGLTAGNKISIFHFRDLMANAKRRADLERKFDDGVARLYRAIEVLAQVELREVYGIEASNVRLKDIPEHIREEFLKKYLDKKDEKIRIPLHASYRLLKELKNELGENFFKYYDGEIQPLLHIRNFSILAHGFEPVNERIFQRLYNSIIKFSGAKEKELPEFPILKI